MKAIYLDPFAGISGNMFLGALLDAGFPFEVLKEELQKLHIGEYELVYRQVNKLGIEAKYFNVLLPEEHEHHHEHHHDHEHSHEHHHEHEHSHDNDHAHEHIHIHQQANAAVSLEEVHEHNHEHCCICEGCYEEGHDHTHGHNHHHSHGADHYHGEHSHEHAHEHHHDHGELPHTHHHHEHRSLKDVMAIVNGSDLSDSIKAKAEQVFRAIAVAEGKVHGKPLEEVHFHEVGAIDTIIDIVGTLIGLEYLGIEKIYVGRINTGFGYVECAHGTMPVPAPATAELLQGLPQERGIVAKEMTTPTGAALMRVLAEVALEQPDAFSSERIAYGAGTREVAIPNVLRMYVGEMEYKKLFPPDVDYDSDEDEIYEVACNIDDMSGELLGSVMKLMLEDGALDVWVEPIMMKKSRPAQKLCALCTREYLDVILDGILFRTTSFGVRYHKVDRKVLDRRIFTVWVQDMPVRIKCGYLDETLLSVKPEYEDCLAIVKEKGGILKRVMEEAKAKAFAIAELGDEYFGF